MTPQNNPTTDLPDLKNPETLKQFQTDYDQIVVNNLETEAFEYANVIQRMIGLSSNLNTSSPKLYNEYLKLIEKLHWYGFPVMTNDRIFKIFREKFMVTYELKDFDLWEKLERKLVTILVLEERNKFKKEVFQALRENEEILTKETITKDGNEIPGQIKNWLLDAQINLGTQPVPSIQLSDYIVSSQNTKNISQDSRDKLLKLLTFVEKLKTPSDTLAGYESTIPVDDVDVKGAIRDGVLDQFDDEEYRGLKKELDSINNNLSGNTETPGVSEPDPSFEPDVQKKTDVPVLEETKVKHLQAKDLIRIYSQNAKEQRAIYEEEKNILQEVGRGSLDVKKELDGAIKQKNRSRLIAFLVVLAKTKDLLSVIQGDNAFKQWLSDKYGSEATEQFTKMPTDPVFYSLWLQYILKEKIAMLESDSARVGTKLANLMGRKYLKVAYIDSVSGSFKWVPVKKGKDRLILAS